MNNGNLRVEYRRTDSLIPYPRNARKHPKAQVAQIAGSIAEFGFLVPVLVDGAGGIIAGHGRVLAAQRLGMESVPCIQATHLTEAQKRAFVLADNKLTENAGWDDELLRLEMTDLNLAGFDLKLTGFDEGDLSRLLTPLDSGEDNPAPDVAKETPVRLGDESFTITISAGLHVLSPGETVESTASGAVLAHSTILVFPGSSKNDIGATAERFDRRISF